MSMRTALYDYYRFELPLDAQDRWSRIIRAAIPDVQSEEPEQAIEWASMQPENRANRSTVSAKDVVVWIRWMRKQKRIATSGPGVYDADYSLEQAKVYMRGATPAQRWEIICSLPDGNDCKKLEQWAVESMLAVSAPVFPPFATCRARAESGACDVLNDESACSMCALVKDVPVADRWTHRPPAHRMETVAAAALKYEHEKK
jgi:hypothetical protein